MPLSQTEFPDADDSVLLRAIKLEKWAEVRSFVRVRVVKEEPASSQADQLVRELDAYGNTALHAALGYKAPDDILLRLIQLYPEATRQHGTDDWLPLHVAAMWGSSSSVLQAIIRAYPEGLDDPGEGGIKGRTPRHFSGLFPHNKELLERSTSDWMASLEEEKTDK